VLLCSIQTFKVNIDVPHPLHITRSYLYQATFRLYHKCYLLCESLFLVCTKILLKRRRFESK